MPAPSSDVSSNTAPSILGHVSLMMDTFLANANAEDLRVVMRGMLAAGPPAAAISLAALARRRLLQTRATNVPRPEGLLVANPTSGTSVPTDALQRLLSRVRTLYGAGLGFNSLKILAVVVRVAKGVQWEEQSELETILAAIDVDISQAIQSCKEEMEGGRVVDMDTARVAVNDLRAAVKENHAVVSSGAGGYLFEQGETALDFWKI